MAPSNYHTGGVELLHQLGSEMIILGIEAYMYYYPLADDPVDEFYRKYHVPYVTDIDDSPHNVLVVSETATQFLYMARNIQRVIWWLSVDFYFNFLASGIYGHSQRDVTAVPMMRFFYFGQQQKEIEHWVQSEYARQFVQLNLGNEGKVRMVGDYLNQEFLREAGGCAACAKRNVVAYNPQKGVEYTRRLMSAGEGLKWVPIENMTPSEVRQCLAKAKVYVDFGEHPGKDRIPREAAISGCVVITGMRGGAANDVDICIGREFKFDERICVLPDIISKIKLVMVNYEAEYAKQEPYRRAILGERDKFTLEVAQAMELPFPRKDTAILAMPDECMALVSSLHKYGRGFLPRYFINDELATGRYVEDCILREHNVNFLLLPSGEKLECVTLEEAAFLCREGRILAVAAIKEKCGSPDEICNALGIDSRELLLTD